MLKEQHRQLNFSLRNNRASNPTRRSHARTQTQPHKHTFPQVTFLQVSKDISLNHILPYLVQTNNSSPLESLPTIPTTSSPTPKTSNNTVSLLLTSRCTFKVNNKSTTLLLHPTTASELHHSQVMDVHRPRHVLLVHPLQVRQAAALMRRCFPFSKRSTRADLGI